MEQAQREALELWRRLFEWTDDPYAQDDYGGAQCFFCGEDSPRHAPDCIFIQARALVERQE